jgi:hypothetical protein
MALCAISSEATTVNLRFTNRIISENFVVSRVGRVSKIRNVAEGTPSGMSTEIQIIGLSAVPVPKVVTTMSSCAQFKMLFKMKF